MAIKDYSTDPDLNVQISGINIAEGCPPSGINNAIRQLMADVKAEQEVRGEEWQAQAAKDAAQDEAIAEAQSSADAVTEELAKYLPLAGGKMRGNLAPSSLYANAPSGSVTFGVGTTWNDSPSLSLYGSNLGDSSAGKFVLRAGNQTYEFFGNVNGELQWGGKNIVRSVNGVGADVEGGIDGVGYPVNEQRILYSITNNTDIERDFVAPANGFYTAAVDTTGRSSALVLTNMANGVNMSCNFGEDGHGVFRAFVPAKKGQTVKLYYKNNGTSTWHNFMFVYGG